MIASLPMYARPELDDAHDAYWALIRHQLSRVGIDSPPKLAQDGDEQRAWTDPSLVLSQTCGMPYRLALHDAVTLLGTPDYELDGCEPGYYRSAVVVRQCDRSKTIGDFRSATFAYNHAASQSGYNAMQEHLAARGFWFENQVHTGQHRASASAVAAGTADIAALDAMSWRLMERYDDFANDLHVLEWTTPTPGLPYISRPDADRDAMSAAIKRAITQLSDEHRSLLGIAGLVSIPAAHYLAVPDHRALP